MKFETFHPGLLGRHDIIAVDMILYPGLWGLFFSHHTPHNNHPRYAADTSTASVLKFLEDVWAGNANVSWDQIKDHTVTTHHLDADALLPVWSLLHPEQALEQREFLERLARCGDFFFYSDDATARLNFIIEALHQRLRGGGVRGERVAAHDLTGACFEWLLPRWADLLDDPTIALDLWEEPMQEMQRDLDYLSVPGRVTEVWDHHTSVILTDHEPDKHALNTLARNDLLLVWRTDSAARRLEVRPSIGWYDIPSLPHRPRYDLQALADQLNAAEVDIDSPAAWKYAPGPGLIQTGHSSLRLESVLNIVHGWIDAAGAESIPDAYRKDVRQVFCHWPRHATYQCHNRFAAAPRLSFRPGAPYGGLGLVRPLDSAAIARNEPDGDPRIHAEHERIRIPFTVSDDYYWNRRSAEPLYLTISCEDHGAGILQVEYDAWGDAFRKTSPVHLTGDGARRTINLSLDDARLANSQTGADFRLELSAGASLALSSLTLGKVAPA